MKAYSITTKGQVTIPLEIREKLKLKPGDRIIYQNTENGIMLKPVKRNMLSDFGFLKTKQRLEADLDTMRESIRRRMAKRARG
jgi:AbrB family looped-hinge helix DNA binding protein